MNPAELQCAMDEMREYYWAHGCLPKCDALIEELADDMAQQIMDSRLAPTPPTIH